MENVKNYLVDLSNGETVCVYVSDKSINENVLTRFAENVTKEKVLDCYEVPQDDLQYYYRTTCSIIILKVVFGLIRREKQKRSKC